MKTMEFKEGETYRVFIGPHTYKIHIMYILDSLYKDEKLVIYRYYGRNKQYWHQVMVIDFELTWKVENAQKSFQKQRNEMIDK